jgi:hypothetical protein
MTPEADPHGHGGAIQPDLNAAVQSIERCLSIHREPQPVRDTIELIRWLAVNDRERFNRLREEAAIEVTSSQTAAPKPPCASSPSPK